MHLAGLIQLIFCETTMHFTFWTFINNCKVMLRSTNIYGARTEARALGGKTCVGVNPGTLKEFTVPMAF